MTTPTFNLTRALELLALPPKDKLIGANLVAILEQLRLAVSRIKELESVWKLADELCTSVDCAAEDIGGCRPAMTILQELGPAVDVARNRT